MQSALTYRTNRDLFSNYYLDEHLPETEEWDEVSDEELQEAYDDIMDLWEREKSTAPKRNESQLEEKFIRPMFRKLGIPFEVEESTSRTQRRPDYGFFETEEAARDAFQRRDEGNDFYRNAVAVADAKRWGRPLDTRGSGEHERDFENPSYQIHVYLQEVDDAQWGVLTDGQKWRLYYGPTSHRLDSYYEVDLPTILEKGDLEDFKYFYLFFRHEAFLEDSGGDSFLDDVYGESNVFAQELGADLQDNIYEAIKVLSEGFMQYPENDLDEADLGLIHDSSLIYLYRLIFVLYAEAEGRELLDTSNEIYEQSYSLNSLKQEVAEEIDSGDPKYRDWQDNLQSRLDELFVLIDQGSKSRGIPEEDLYIPAYNGGLFRTDPDEDDSEEARFLANHDVGDAYLARVIELLTRSRNGNGGGKIFVDYSSLEVRHLGSIYEGLLEYQINVAHEPLAIDDGEYVIPDEGDDVVVQEGEVYLTTGSGERKATGSYYTPEYVVEYIVENTLEPLVSDIRNDLMAQSARGDRGFAAEFAERVFDLKILDPAMGSGHFLTSAIDYLAREIIDAQEKQAAQQGIETVDEEHDINWARRKVAQRCIYGVDLNPLAVELAKVSLWLRTLAAEQPLAFLDHHLKTGNSLVGSDIADVLSNGESDAPDGQLTLQQSFARTRQKALEHVMGRFQDLLSIDNETLEDVKEMEDVYDEVREDQLYQRLIAMANVHTGEQFDLHVPGDAYERMAEALRDDSWNEIEEQDWFRNAQAMADEEAFFHWELEYPVAFYGENGERRNNAGFDAVIGNPPYVKIQNLHGTAPRLADHLNRHYTTSTGRFDIYACFVERGSQLASGQRLTYILPNKFFESSAGEGLRTYLSEKDAVKEILDFGHQQVFDGATTYTCILSLGASDTFEYGQILQSSNPHPDLSNVSFTEIDLEELGEDPWILTGPEERALLHTIEEGGIQLGNRSKYISEGIVSGDNKILFVELLDVGEELTKVRTQVDDKERELESELVHPLAMGDEINRYTTPSVGMGVIYPYRETEQGTDLIPENILKSEYPRTYSYLDAHQERLTDRGSESMDYPAWYALWCPRQKPLFEAEKLLTPDICQYPKFTTDSNGDHYFANTAYGLVPENNTVAERHFLLSVLNSSLTWFYIYYTSPILRGDFRRFMTSYLERVPIVAERPSELKSEVDDIDRLVDENPANALAYLGSEMIEMTDRRASLNLSLRDYLGNYNKGPKLPDVGLFQPTSSNILDATAEDYEKLRVGEVKTERDAHHVTVYATARYKPEDEGEFETDQWGYTETEYSEAFTIADLSEEEATLVEEFVPVAVEEADGFADFRDTATKTNSPIDRIKAITLPNPDNIEDDLRRYIQTKERAAELDERIKKTDTLIDNIVYDLYDLTDKEIELVESIVQDD
ncbi:Eco57I restriction-modification methylase domain-containing protein [Halorubrum sp. DTA98]|uniref:Eco57I restriction-modification methylase domain-containing protein n=1 Tax=Halorubrum sp. DTA98 TaxID=3402163 RepID=UPI003AB0DBA3